MYQNIKDIHVNRRYYFIVNFQGPIFKEPRALDFRYASIKQELGEAKTRKHRLLYMALYSAFTTMKLSSIGFKWQSHFSLTVYLGKGTKLVIIPFLFRSEKF